MAMSREEFVTAAAQWMPAEEVTGNTRTAEEWELVAGLLYDSLPTVHAAQLTATSLVGFVRLEWAYGEDDRPFRDRALNARYAAAAGV